MAILPSKSLHPLPDKTYSTTQIRALEQAIIDEQACPSFQLMQDAGAESFKTLISHWPHCRSISVFCGGGNNGGDGYVLATCALETGFEVNVFTAVPTEQLTGDAQLAFQLFTQAHGEILTIEQFCPSPHHIIVDALLGTGLNRPVTENYAQLIDIINQSDNPVLSIDIPSGLNANTGQVMGCSVKAAVTVSFIGLKPGLFTCDAAEYCGEIIFAPLNVPDHMIYQQTPVAYLLQKPLLPKRQRCIHKGNNGQVLVIGGNHGFSGAARLAGEAALRSGAGLVSIATRTSHAALLNIDRPELMCHGIDSATALQPLLDQASVVVIGPGLGQDDWAQMLFAATLACKKPCVVDADALNLLAKQPCFSEHWVLTPHPGEAARLLSSSTQRIAENRFDSVSSLVKRYGGVCVLKGAGTLIAGVDNIWIATTGNPGMASGGMGDVLAGIIGGLIAQGLSLEQATQLAVFIHGEAADILAAQYGERGLLASDLLPEIRQLLN